jgi:hypothetical protein
MNAFKKSIFSKKEGKITLFRHLSMQMHFLEEFLIADPLGNILSVFLSVFDLDKKAENPFL